MVVQIEAFARTIGNALFESLFVIATCRRKHDSARTGGSGDKVMVRVICGGVGKFHGRWIWDGWCRVQGAVWVVGGTGSTNGTSSTSLSMFMNNQQQPPSTSRRPVKGKDNNGENKGGGGVYVFRRLW